MVYFEDAEFTCSCCGKNKMNDGFLTKLDKARAIAGVPFRISSGYRCPNHNRVVGGKPQSSHLAGHAADIVVRSSRDRFKIFKGLIEAGFTRIGVGKSFIHVDDDKNKAPEVCWRY